MTAPRQVVAGAIYLVTRRCAQRQFLLKPSRTTSQTFLYVLALAARRYGIRVQAFCVLSNQYDTTDVRRRPGVWRCRRALGVAGRGAGRGRLACEVDTVFEAFVREWGAWSVSLLSLGVAALAYVNSRRAVRIAATEHEWKAGDRAKMLASEASASEERAWCERIRLQLEAAPDDPIAVPDDRLDWALRGDGKYFQVVRQGNLVWVYPADYHIGPVLG